MHGTVAQRVDNKTFLGKIIGQNFSIKIFFEQKSDLGHGQEFKVYQIYREGREAMALPLGQF